MTEPRYTVAELLTAVKQACTDGALNLDQGLRLFEAHPDYVAAALNAADAAAVAEPERPARSAHAQRPPELPGLIVKAVQALPPQFSEQAQHDDLPEHYGSAGRDWADVELWHDAHPEPSDLPAFLTPPAQQPAQVSAPTVAMDRAALWHPGTAPVDLDALAHVIRTGELPVQTPTEQEQNPHA